MVAFTLAQVRKGRYPAPVYEGHFADGTVHRMSFWSEAGKPLDIEHGRRVVELSIQKPVVTGIVEIAGVEVARETPAAHDVPVRAWPLPFFMPGRWCAVSAAKVPTARPVEHEGARRRKAKPVTIPAELRAAIESGDLEAARRLLAAA